MPDELLEQPPRFPVTRRRVHASYRAFLPALLLKNPKVTSLRNSLLPGKMTYVEWGAIL